MQEIRRRLHRVTTSPVFSDSQTPTAGPHFFVGSRHMGFGDQGLEEGEDFRPRRSDNVLTGLVEQ